MNILVTGFSGFIGSYLTESLLIEGHKVFGLTRNGDKCQQQYQTDKRLSIITGDLENIGLLKGVLIDNKIERVFHLASKAFSSIPGDLYKVNIIGTSNLLEAMCQSKRSINIILMSSSAVYGNGEGGKKFITEECILKPVTTYGVSKATIDLMGDQFYCETKLSVFRVRPFNVIGPGQKESFICSKAAKQIMEVDKGIRKPVLELGNLSSYRDFIDVRDVVEGMIAISEKGRPGEAYNLCVGKAILIADVVDYMIRSAGQKIEVRSNSKALATDVEYQKGSYKKVNNDTGWRPEISLEKSLDDILKYWKEKIEIYEK